MKSYFIIIMMFGLIGCAPTKNVVTNYYCEDKSVNLFAFVGKKISVTEFDPNTEKQEEIKIDSVTGETIIQKFYVMDVGFKCKYLVINNVFNKLENDTIEFIAYDHYGRPAFEEPEYVLLYISKSSKGNHFFHQKYQYDYLRKNSDGIFYGHNYTVRQTKKHTTYKNKRIANLEELFNNKKEGVFNHLFKQNEN